MSMQKSLKTLQEGDWVEVFLKPKKVLVQICEIRDDGRVFGDVDGDPNDDFELVEARVKSIKKVPDPHVIYLDDIPTDPAVIIFHDGRVRLERELEELPSKLTHKVFRYLADVLGYDLVG